MRAILLCLMVVMPLAAQVPHLGGKRQAAAVITSSTTAIEDQPGWYTYEITVQPRYACSQMALELAAYHQVANFEQDPAPEEASQKIDAGASIVFTGKAQLAAGATWGQLRVAVELTPLEELPPNTPTATATAVLVGTHPTSAESLKRKSGEPIPERKVPIQIRTRPAE